MTKAGDTLSGRTDLGVVGGAKREAAWFGLLERPGGGNQGVATP